MADKINISMVDGYYSPSTVLWLLAEDLTVRQAALLLLNEDPEDYPDAEYPDNHRQVPSGYQAARQVIASALLAKRITGLRAWKTKTAYDPDGLESWQEEIEGDLCANRSTINMDSLRAWLASKNVTVEQFAGLSRTSDDFLDREDPSYSPKLAATIAAWRHVKQNPINGLSIKRQLADWLHANSARFWPDGMDSKVTDTFVNEAARIANWDAEGGRPAISDTKNEKSAVDLSDRFSANRKTVSPPAISSFDADLDDEIPF